MSEQAASTAGRFVWRDLMTSNKDAAAAFYEALFGWTTQQVPMGGAGEYTMLSIGETSFGGMNTLDASHGMPSHWMDYLTVDDVDAACATVEANGGKIAVPAFDLPNIGRTAVIQDPGGAHIHLFRSNTPGATPLQTAPADFHFCWSQLLTDDPGKVLDFYRTLVGWTIEPMGGDQYVCKVGEVPVGSIMKKPAEADQAPPHWMDYVTVPDVDDYLAKAVELGATTYVPPMDLPGMGRFAVFADPTGASIALWKNAMPTP